MRILVNQTGRRQRCGCVQPSIICARNFQSVDTTQVRIGLRIDYLASEADMVFDEPSLFPESVKLNALYIVHSL